MLSTYVSLVKSMIKFIKSGREIDKKKVTF